MKGNINFILGILVGLLLAVFLYDDFGVFYIKFALSLIGVFVYAVLVFKKGFSIKKLVLGLTGILVIQIILTFIADMDFALIGLFLAIFLVEAMNKKKEAK
ncbi:hypothetical protein [Saliterribacillus persicus]|uniref:Uncharacterized protein n=1 Tax=Saliterribacillus persicus TaxID=930114 RepID=A0A368YBH2_9BACI|nr:hypothetical protein [Saliterribacillus persicus]RCW76778.1 hypothetical protein DFR57_10253 [Saliterribacillus persicus]